MAQKRSAPAYSKAQLLGFRRFAARRDLLEALLGDGQRYTVGQAEKLLEKFLKRKER